MCAFFSFPCFKLYIFHLGIGLIGGSIFGSAGLTFWFGVKELVDNPNTLESGTVVSVSHLFLALSYSFLSISFLYGA